MGVIVDLEVNMKTRIISAVVVLAIFIPLLFLGGTWFNMGMWVVSMIGLWEFLNIKNEKKEVPPFVRFISYIMMSALIFYCMDQSSLSFTLDYRLLACLFLVFLIPTILYHDREKYSINDAFYLIGGILFLGISLSLIMAIRNMSLSRTIYLFLITIMTDTYAYFTGMLLGKHKLLESISPKKTVEGMIGGTFFGVLIPTIFYHYVVSAATPIYQVVIVTLFLSILGQFGDLVFSCIKRYFGKKDFSNIMPGHGGVLDRLDSIIFVVLGFVFFILII